MINKKNVIPITLVALGLSIQPTSTLNAQREQAENTPPAQNEIMEAIRAARNKRSETLDQILTERADASATRACVRPMTVRQIWDGGAHFNVGDRMIVVGPIAWIELLVITPVPGMNPWAPGDFIFTPYVFSPDIRYQNTQIPIIDHDEPAPPHTYSVRVIRQDDDGCPTEIILDGHHTEGLIFLDPGHARAL